MSEKNEDLAYEIWSATENYLSIIGKLNALHGQFLTDDELKQLNTRARDAWSKRLVALLANVNGGAK